MKDVLLPYMKRFSDLCEEELKQLIVEIPVQTGDGSHSTFWVNSWGSR
ncbi:hypothetical protein QTG56_10850 [Rossellomorea sp. AcN35-11]|nr:hypothetical protein [Rossellomorea aquimaris]NMH67900.1 hypothetical protein [Bacillus sp. RO3]WJV31375.1 hypothetical protein QTG56_10850 [Rossellomorea sp. AcN35-11]